MWECDICCYIALDSTCLLKQGTKECTLPGMDVLLLVALLGTATAGDVAKREPIALMISEASITG
jgi:hypothetical protein